MTWITVAPALAALLFLAFVASLGAGFGAGSRHGWLLAASLSIAFALWSVFAIVTEGPLAFWAEHTRNAWGNQIWFELLLMAAVACAALAPQAKAAGMRVPWWLLLLAAATGSVGMLAMAARLLYLKGRAARAA